MPEIVSGDRMAGDISMENFGRKEEWVEHQEIIQRRERGFVKAFI